MAIDWNQIITVSDEDTVNVIAGKKILFMGEGGGGGSFDITVRKHIMGELGSTPIDLQSGQKVYDIRQYYFLYQSGSGVPSSENIRPFVGITGCTLSVCDGDTVLDSADVSFVYNGSAYTLYDGYYDSVSGMVYTSIAHIASYNGEDLTGKTWLSDRDVQTGNNSPTIGAEVVYYLGYVTFRYVATPKTWQEIYTGEQINVRGSRKPSSIASESDRLMVATEVKVNDIETFVCSMIAPMFDSTVYYSRGNYVTYQGGIFRFQISHQGDWSDGDVEQITIMEEIMRRTTS